MPTKVNSLVSFEYIMSLLYTYSYVLLAGGVYGIVVAHFPFFIGSSWSFCEGGGNVLHCVLMVHLWEATSVSYNIFVAWYIFRYTHLKTLHRTFVLLIVLVFVDLTFFGFEIGTILDGLHSNAPHWEAVVLSSVSLILLGGGLLGTYVLYVMTPFVFRKKAHRAHGSGIPNQGPDGYFHPESEEEIIALIAYANENKLKLRCRGAGHSVSWAIFSGSESTPNTTTIDVPPNTKDINIMLDQMNGLKWHNNDPKTGIAEVEAGIHLGIDPGDFTGTSTYDNSLLIQAWKEGWALNDLGGITHQTIGGFLSTGSSGGSLSHHLDENILAIRAIDGNGKAAWYDKDKDEDLFNALGVSMGLLGIITKVRLKFVPNFNIEGLEVIIPTDQKKNEALIDYDLDIFGPGRDKSNPNNKRSLEQFLKEEQYTRILWYPQKGIERLGIWTAKRVSPEKPFPNCEPVPYREFTKKYFSTYLEELGAALLFTLAGNKGVIKPWVKLGTAFATFHGDIYWLFGKKVGKILSAVFSCIFLAIIILISFIFFVLPFGIFRKLYLKLFPKLLGMLQANTPNPIPKDVYFHDYMWSSLPMDNGASDILMGIEFTEIWIPLSYTEKVMNLLNDHFTTGGSAATGYSMVELYAGAKSKYWLSPSYGHNVLRVDVFWYRANDGDPSNKAAFYDQFWCLLRNNNIPFRLHWAKFLPNYDYDGWAEYLKSQYSRWDDFMDLRAKSDPNDIFLTEYWSKRLNVKAHRKATRPDRAMVISGGGARGGWGVGVARGLSEHNNYQLVVGTSTGSLMGPLILLRKFDTLAAEYTSITQNEIFNVNPFKKNGDIKPLTFIWRLLTGKKTLGETLNMRTKIKEVFTQQHYDELMSKSFEFAAATTSLTTGKPGYKSTLDYSYDDMVDWIWASANTPIFMSNLYKEGEVWADGGLRVFIPIAHAMMRGAKTIDVLVHDNTNFGSVGWTEQGGFFNLILRVFAIYYIGTGVANIEDLGLENETSKYAHDINFYFMGQEELDLIGNDLVMDAAKMKIIMKKGYQSIVDGSLIPRPVHIKKGQPIGTIRLD